MTVSDFNVQALADINRLGVIYSLQEGQFISGVDDCKGVIFAKLMGSNLSIRKNYTYQFMGVHFIL